MTEETWFTSLDPLELLHGLYGLGRLPSGRKLTLFVWACTRRLEYTEPRPVRAAWRAAEDLADPTFALTDRLRNEHFPTAYPSFLQRQPLDLRNPHRTDLRVVLACLTAINTEFTARLDRGDQPAQADLLREVVSNPFQAPALDPAWLGPTPLGLAQGIYRGRRFDRLPILADALEDAGCDELALLAHCRGPGPHVRGCWVVDLVLGQV